jgi:hypothetical protein
VIVRSAPGATAAGALLRRYRFLLAAVGNAGHLVK